MDIKEIGEIVEDKHTKEELKKLQSLDLDAKIEIAEARILEFYQKMEGKVYVSFSGGKDSTVLLHLVRRMFGEKIMGVFCDTGLEFPEIKEYVKEYPNITTIRPEMNFREVLDRYGYPIVSKEVADTIWYAKRNPDGIRFKQKLSGELKGISKYDQSKWKFLLDAPFDLNAKCCKIMKKKPFAQFNKASGLRPFIGTTADESMLRNRAWIINGCNSFEKGKEKSAPLSVWMEKDIREYIDRYQITLAKPYYMGYLRTGCIYCAFGAHLEKLPNRFMLLQNSHPALYEYCMKPKSEGGLGMALPLDYIGVKYTDDQLNLFDQTIAVCDKKGKCNDK